jgi:hypothetical protein
MTSDGRGEQPPGGGGDRERIVSPAAVIGPPYFPLQEPLLSYQSKPPSGAPERVGVVGAVFIATRLGVGSLAFGVTWPHILGASLLAGIGFTMSLFITGLAFEDPGLVGDAKIGILSASMIAAVAGYVILRMVGARGSAVTQ